ncbi:MAG: hypothetical protein ABI634_13985, partial [Acidobacteriota bacterium]
MSKGIVGDPVTRGLINGVNEGTTPLERPTLNRVRITDTGTKNDYALDSTAVSPITGFAYLEWNGASSVTFTGFAAGRDGEVRRIRNITAAQAMLFTHQAAGSTAANRLRTPGSVSTQAIGPGGTVDIVYNSADSRWELVIL